MGVATARRHMFFRTSQRDRSGGGACLVPSGDFKTSETSALIKETAKNAPPNSVSPTATTRQTTQPMSSRLDNPSNMRHHGIGRDSNIICVVSSQRKKVHRLSPCNAESVTARAMNRTAPEGGQGLLFVPRRGAPS